LKLNRTIAFETPTNPLQFDAQQIRPRVVLGLSITALARWFATHLVPYPRLVHDYRSGFVFTTTRLDSALPVLQFSDAEWLAVAGQATLSDSAKYLHLRSDIAARRQNESHASRHVATFEADMRIVNVVEPHALTALPGTLPESLAAKFKPEEIYHPDRTAIARASTPPEGTEIFHHTGPETTVCRSHCEVADQWSFIEVTELLTTERERLFSSGAAPDHISRMAVANPMRSITSVFQRALYTFDTFQVITRVLTNPSDETKLVFLYTLTEPSRQETCVTTWEELTTKLPTR